MNTQEIMKMIDSYFDNELEKSKEPMMFMFLSQDPEAREHFKKMNALKTGIANSLEEFPYALDEKILRKVGDINETHTSFFINKKVFTALTYSLTIVLLVLTIFFYTRSEEYKVQFFDLTREVKKQNDKLELLMNALPPVEVTGGYLQAKQIVVRPNI